MPKSIDSEFASVPTLALSEDPTTPPSEQRRRITRLGECSSLDPQRIESAREAPEAPQARH